MSWPPLYHAAGEARPSQESGRWHEMGEGYAQYLSLDPHGAWAEILRYFSVRGEDLAAELRRNLWVALVREKKVADLSRFEDYARAGLDPGVAVGEHAASRRLARELKDAGFRGVLSPNAALPGSTNLTLFGERYESLMVGSLETFDNPDPGVWVACSLVVEAAAPPRILVHHTCFRGEKHLGFERWKGRG